MIKILKEIGYGKGVFHCFSGNWEETKTILDLGFYVSFSGSITYDGRRLAEVIKKVPLERVLVETDAPYLAPNPFRGKRNEPSYLPYVVGKISEILGKKKEEVGEKTTENAKRLFLSQKGLRADFS